MAHLPKAISEWQTAEFAMPVGAKGWSHTPPCISGVARQSADAPGKLWAERRQQRRLRKAHERERKNNKGSVLEASAKARECGTRSPSDVCLCRLCHMCMRVL